MNTSIIISSCDAYKDLWEPMIYSFKQFWPDCPFPIYLISNHEEMETPPAKFIKIGKDKGFCSNMKEALNSIPSEYFILLLDDYFLDKRVNNNIIVEHVQFVKKNNIDFLKIDSCELIFRDNYRIGDSFYCENPVDKKYALNTAIAIWKKDAFCRLCLDGISAWEFERKGAHIAKQNKITLNSITILSSAIEHQTISKIGGAGAVRKGRWTTEGLYFLKKHGFESLVNLRDKEGWVTSRLISLYKPNSILWIPFGILLRIIQKFKINI